MYGKYDHSIKENIYEACNIDSDLVKRIHTKLLTDIKECDCMSEAVVRLEDPILLPDTAAKMARPISIIIISS